MTQTIITKRKPQENWKRSQIRLPNDLYQEINDYATEKGFSLNSALISLVEHGLIDAKQNQNIEIEKFEHKFNRLASNEQQLIMQLIERLLQGTSP